MKDHRTIDCRSLALHRLVAGKLRADSRLLDLALGNLVRWEPTASTAVRPVLAEWRALLVSTVDEVIAVLIGEDERSVRLRQSSPFAGALTPEERFGILREFQPDESRAA